MSGTDRLERELTTWFQETAVPRKPDYTSDILAATARVRQRPRWSVPARWLPETLTTAARQERPVPWRTIALIAMLGLLVGSMVAVYVGSQRRLPAPFGPAANGLVAYAREGDIYLVDPTSGRRQPVITSPFEDATPRFSLDGTRLAFLRADRGGHRVLTANPDGTNEVEHTARLLGADGDSLAWSQDGRTVAVAADPGAGRTVYFIDTVGGTGAMTIPENYIELEVYWRPPHGREVMYVGRDGASMGLFLFSLDTRSRVKLPVSSWAKLDDVRPIGWTLDGRRFVVTRHIGEDRFTTHIVDAETGGSTDFDMGFGRLSHDGTRIVGLVGNPATPSVCVAPVAGGLCRPIGFGFEPPHGTSANGLRWSPDDEWILSIPENSELPVLLDPDGELPNQPLWLAEGGESWQRLAP